MQCISWETLGWKKHKLESRLPREISITLDMQMTSPLWQKVKRTKWPLDESEIREWKNWFKTQHSENEDHGIWSHHFMGNRWGNSGNNGWLYFAAAKSLQSCPTLCDPIDGSPPGSPVPGILQARTLEWVAISFSNAWKLGGSKITADGDCSHEIKRCLLLGRKVMTNINSILKSRDITLPTKIHIISYDFSSSHVWMWELDYKES